ncbi:hypothetical protein D1872_144030 [compost metagenome]
MDIEERKRPGVSALFCFYVMEQQKSHNMQRKKRVNISYVSFFVIGRIFASEIYCELLYNKAKRKKVLQKRR